MPQQHFKIVFPFAYSVELEPETPLPAPGEDEFVLETHFSLLSPGTELAFYMGTHVGLQDPHNTWASYPFFPGYAAVGRVIARGARVPTTDPAALYFTDAPHAAHSLVKTGTDKFLLPIPAGVPPQQAIFCRLAAIAATGVELAPVSPGERVVMLGAGLIGNLAAQHFRLGGARVACVETNAARLERARRCGLLGVAAGEDLKERLREALNGEPDVVVEATGVPALLNSALELVRERGRVVLLGAPRGMTEIDAYKHLFGRGVQVTGGRESLQGHYGLTSRLELTRQSLDLITRGKLQIEPLLTQVLPASQVQKAYEMLIHEPDKAVGVVLDWQ